MSFFEKNLELLRNVSEPLAARMVNIREAQGEPTQIEPFALEPSRSGLPTVHYTGEEQSFYVHSPYDPMQEATQFADRIMADEKEGNFWVFFGMGLGYGVQEVLKRIPKKDRVLVFEPHFNLFYLAFCHTDLSTMMTRDNTTLSCDPSVQGAMLNYMNLFELATFKGVKLVSNPTFDRLPQADNFDQMASRIRYEMMAVGGNVQTLMVMGEMQQMNIILNLPHVFDNPPFIHLMDKFKDKPAIIVSAGPSLEKNMHLLREAKDRAVIVAVDTAVRPLLKEGIYPHIVVSGDPQEANYRHLKGLDLPETYLIVEPQCPVGTLNDWTGPKFICSFHDNMMQWVDRVIGDRGRVIVWGSVAVMAYDVCVKIGADPIVFIGQDLSFPDGKTYTSGTVFEVEDKMDMTVKKLEKDGTPLIDMEDIFGNEVKTNRQMFAYFNFLKNRFLSPEVAGRTIINATEGGILKGDKIEVLPLRDTIDKYMQDALDVDGILDYCQQQGNPINYTNLMIELDTLMVTLREALEYSFKGIDAVRNTLKYVELDDKTISSRKDIITHYNRMVNIRLRMVRKPETGKIIEMANQAGIYSFAQGVKTTEFTPGEEFDTEFVKRGCYHYHTLYETTKGAVERLIPLIENVRSAARKRMEQEQEVPVGTK